MSDADFTEQELKLMKNTMGYLIYSSALYTDLVKSILDKIDIKLVCINISDDAE
jgi:hypothetical protein